MKILDLIKLLTNHLNYLGQQKMHAESRGDVAEVLRVEGEIEDTSATLETLKENQ